MLRMRIAVRGKRIRQDKENCNLLCQAQRSQGFTENDFLQSPKNKTKQQ